MATDPVERLAREGRETRERAQQRERLRLERAESDNERLARLSTTRVGLLGYYLGMLLIGLPTFLLAALAVVSLGAESSESGLRSTFLVCTIPLAFAFGVSFGGRLLADNVGRRTLLSTMAWARGLPFQLVGLIEMLRADPPKNGWIVVRFADKSIDSTKVADAALSLRKVVTSTHVRKDGAVAIVSGWFSNNDDMGPNAPTTNQRYLRWVRVLVDRLLLTLHAQHPIESVTVMSGQWGSIIDLEAPIPGEAGRSEAER